MQVGRSSASAVAFGIGLFAGEGTLGAGKQRAFSVITDNKDQDIRLRFHDTCMAYKVRSVISFCSRKSCIFSSVAQIGFEALKFRRNDQFLKRFIQLSGRQLLLDDSTFKQGNTRLHERKEIQKFNM